MNKCLVIAACLGMLLLAGCNRCGQWDWYKPCDLIEGRAERTCGPCGSPCQYRPGQVVRREWAVPAETAPAAAPAPESPAVMEEEAPAGE